jgi:hypothetical protein
MKSGTLKNSGADLALFLRRHPWLTGTAVFVALCGLCYLGLEWHSEMSWQRYAAAARARGVKMQLVEFARPEIPDEQNFAALPMMRKVVPGNGEGTPFKLPSGLKSPPAFGDPIHGQWIDWREWQKYFHSVGYLTETSDKPAGDVLRALEHYAPLFQEWSEWRTRPQCRFALDYSKGLLLEMSHLSIFQNAARLFSLRMRAHLALGDSAAAYSDFQEGQQAYRALQEEPMLISGLVRIANLHLLLAAVGDGLRDRAWSDAECEKIERDLAAIHIWQDWRQALSAERGAFNTTMDWCAHLSLRERNKEFANYATNQALRWTVGLLPRRIIRDNQLRQNHFIDEVLEGFDATNQTFDLDHPTPSSPQNITGTFEEYHYFLCRVSSPVFSQIELRYAQIQTKLDLARIACALERFRRAHGVYPETLAELAPNYLPVVPIDFYSRAPLHYQRVGDASFRMYSVGENRKDDGGQVAPGVPERKQLDAIWPYAPSPAAPTAP